MARFYGAVRSGATTLVAPIVGLVEIGSRPAHPGFGKAPLCLAVDRARPQADPSAGLACYAA
jgi:hypothetical protein